MNPSHFRAIPIKLIVVSKLWAKREVKKSNTKELGDSIEAFGALAPPLVRPKGEGFELLAGYHRLKAHKQLGHTEITCRVLEVDDDNATLISIEENVRRYALSASEKREHLKRWKAAYERKFGATNPKGGRPRKTGNQVQGFVEHASEAMGVSPRAVRKALSGKTTKAEAAPAVVPAPTSPLVEQVASGLIDLGKKPSEARALAEIAVAKSVSRDPMVILTETARSLGPMVERIPPPASAPPAPVPYSVPTAPPAPVPFVPSAPDHGTRWRCAVIAVIPPLIALRDLAKELGLDVPELAALADRLHIDAETLEEQAAQHDRRIA